MAEKKKILILSAGPQSRLVKEFADRDFEAEVMHPEKFYPYISNAPSNDRIYLKGDENDPKNKRITLKQYAAVVPRISGAGFEYGKLIVKHLSENMKVFTTASEFGLSLCSNKFETCQFLSRCGVRVPKQILAHNLTDYRETIKQVGGFPFILKLQRGSQGAGVFLIRDEVEASQTLRALKYSGMDLVLSQKLDSGEPANDLRVWVIGGLTDEPKIFAYKRFAMSGDFRSNYSLSGSGETVELTTEEEDLAIRTAKALRMNIVGVDIMRDKPDGDKSYVIEANGNPGLAGIEAVTGKNIAGEVAEFVVNNYKSGNTWDSSLYGRMELLDVQTVKYYARKALEFTEACNLYGDQSLYKKNFTAQEYMKRLIKQADRWMLENQEKP